MTSSPVHLAGDAWLIRSLRPVADPATGPGPWRIHANAMVLTDGEPVLVDTGTPAMRDELWAQLGSLVDPADVRWVFLSDDDADHVGNLEEVLERCPEATVVASWLLARRLDGTVRLPADRTRWVADGQSFQAGDRTLLALRPPAYDSPATRGLWDERTGVYWSADCFATPVPGDLHDVADLDDDVWAQAFVDLHLRLSPWLADVDPVRWRRAVGRVAALGPPPSPRRTGR